MAINSLSTGFRPGVCTSGTRPTAPYEGQFIYETDTDMLAIWNGTAWRYIASTTATSGSILQVTEGTTQTQVSVSSTTFTDTLLTATIVPKSSTSKILVLYSQSLYTQSVATGIGLQLCRQLPSPNTVLKTEGNLNYGTASGVLSQQTFFYLDSPNSTSSLTYKTRLNRDFGTGSVFAQVNSTLGTSQMTLFEIAA
jgi:hypothetical protein